MWRASAHMYVGSFDEALADFRHAFELSPNFAWNLFYMAVCEAYVGLTSDAREHAELGFRLSPRDVDVWLASGHLALALASFVESDFDECARHARVAIQVHENAPVRHALMASVCGHLNDDKTARRHLQVLNKIAPGFISNIVDGTKTVFKSPAHSRLLIEGLEKAASSTSNVAWLAIRPPSPCIRWPRHEGTHETRPRCRRASRRRARP